MRSLIVLALVSLPAIITFTGAYDPLDPSGNITITWDLFSWTPDGYVAVVGVKNNQKYRPITSPGWKLGWTWSSKEVIWTTFGARPTHQGDCSRFKGNIPTSCERRPTIVDVSPATPYNQQIANCCKSGFLTPLVQDAPNSKAQFQITVGAAGTTNKTVKLPKNFTLLGPGHGYTCGPAKVIRPTIFTTQDGRRKTEALMTFQVVCAYSRFLARKQTSCCVSLWSNLDGDFTHCPSSSPIHVRWNSNFISKQYLGAELTISNSNHRNNIKPWNLVLQHRGLNSLTRVSSGFNFKPITVSESGHDGIDLYGKKGKNDVLRKNSRIRVELEMRRNKESFTYKNDSMKVYFNGEECKLPRSHVKLSS